MLTAIQGQVKDNAILLDPDTLRPFNGRLVTIIINDPVEEEKDAIISRRHHYLSEHRDTTVPSGRTATEVDSYIKEIRKNDRF